MGSKKMTISLQHQEWLEERGISAETAAQYGVYTGKSEIVGEGKDRRQVVHPDPSGDLLAFPTRVGDVTVGEHYRRPAKKQFFQKKGSKQVFWNFQCLLDPALERGEPLVICEGQLDALTAIDCGFPFAVSMPSGAQKPPEGRMPEDLDPLDPNDLDRPNGRFGSLYHARTQLKTVKRVIIATDNDEAGVRLAAELVRRLGPGRCSRAEYPKGCKDLNDVRRNHGREAVIACLNKARPYPTKGVYRLSEIIDPGEPQIYTTGWPVFDAHCKLAEGTFAPLTGIPQHGKSLFMVNVLVRVAQRHPVRIGLTSFESPIKPIIQRRLLRMALPCAFSAASVDQIAETEAWLENHFIFIEHDPTDESEEDVTIEWMLDRFHDALMRYDVKIFFIDPWNEIEHQRDFRESQSEYQNRAIRKMKAFCKRLNCTLIVAAHPTKDIHEKGKIRMPNLYDIDGSAAWRNKADIGLVVHREDLNANKTSVKIDKAKYEFLGKVGFVDFQYNPILGRFEEIADTAGMLDAA